MSSSTTAANVSRVNGMARLRFMTPFCDDSTTVAGWAGMTLPTTTQHDAGGGGDAPDDTLLSPYVRRRLSNSVGRCTITEGAGAVPARAEERGDAETGGRYVRDAGRGDAGAGRPR